LSDPLLDEVNLTTLKEIYPDAVEDNIFLDAPFLAHLRKKAMVPFTGGAFMQTVFIYAPLIGGAYVRGQNFNINKPQTLSGTEFDPKYYEVSVVEYKEDIQVLNRGDLSIFRLIDIDMQNGIQTISAIIALDLQQNGQLSARLPNINGWTEAINDGYNPSWDGNVYTTYGTSNRNGAVAQALNGNVFWAGDQLGNTGPLTYQLLEEAYQTAAIGRDEPDLGVCNKLAYAAIKERIQPQQRFAQERDPYWGANGMRMNNALILKDDYFPSAKYGSYYNTTGLGSFATSTISYTAPSTVVNGFPSSNQTLTVGEVFCWFNTRKFLLRLADDPEFGLGFSGFVPAQDNTRVAGQIKAAMNLECIAPRLNTQIYGIGG
jgi:hypothetical protein